MAEYEHYITKGIVKEMLFSTRNAPHANINFVIFFSESMNFKK